MAFLDALDPSAAAIDSVNTIVNADGVLTGYNTDYLAVRTLLADVPRGAFALRGSGGMAKAVLAALVDSGFTDGTVVARNPAAGSALAQRYGVRVVAGPRRPAPRLLLNATPIGMSGGPEAEDLAFPPDAVRAAGTVLDAVYLPADTPLVRLARASGAAVIAGGAIMELQALEQFALYTGVRPSAEQVARAEAYASA